MVDLLEKARRAAALAVNSVMTATYWEIGRRIVAIEQRGRKRKDYYGEEIVDRLSSDLTLRFGRGFGRRNLFQMRSFYLAYSEIVQTLSALSDIDDLQRFRRECSGEKEFILTEPRFHRIDEICEI